MARTYGYRARRKLHKGHRFATTPEEDKKPEVEIESEIEKKETFNAATIETATADEETVMEHEEIADKEIDSYLEGVEEASTEELTKLDKEESDDVTTPAEEPEEKEINHEDKAEESRPTVRG